MKRLSYTLIDIVVLAVVASLCGCAFTSPLKGGKATISKGPAGVIEQTVVQSDSPSQASRQDQETVKTRSYTVPAGSRLEETTMHKGASGLPVTSMHAIDISAPMPVVEREESRAKAELGAAQKDTAREIGAKLASLKGVVWIGVALFIFGVASLFYPPLKLIIGSVTTSVAVNRTVREYTEQHYLLAVTAYLSRAANKGAIGRQMADWRHSLDQKWATLRFGEVKVEIRGEQHVFEIQVCLNGLDPKAVRAELYADGVNGGGPVRQEMKFVRQLADAAGNYAYSAAVSAVRPATDYTARLIPNFEGVAIPLEDTRILWQR